MKYVIFLMLLSSSPTLAQTPPTNPSLPAQRVSDAISTDSTGAEKKIVPAEKPVRVFKKNVVIMLALNYNKGEIEAVKSAAIARGQDFVLLPEMDHTREDVVRRANVAEEFQHRELFPLMERAANAKGKEKSVLDKRVNELSEVTAALLNGTRGFTQVEMAKVLSRKVEELQKSGVGVDTLVISAHNSGSSFFGTLGRSEVEDITRLTVENPSFKNSLRAVFLMGCYTATTELARLWKADFPKLELVAGYDQPAPLRDAPQGWNYIHDVMVLQKSLTDKKDKDEMNEVANKITDINKVGSAFAVFPACENCTEKKEYYRGKITHNRVDEFDLKFCELARPEFEKNYKLYKEYTEGKKIIPNDTSHSPLRELYSFYRTHEICYGIDPALGPRANEVFFLVFHHIVRANFFKYYQKDLAKLLANYNKLNLNSLKPAARSVLAFLRTKQGRHLKLSDDEYSRLDSVEYFLAEMNQMPNVDQKFRALLQKASDPMQLQKMSVAELGFLAQDLGAIHSLVYQAAVISRTLKKTEALRANFERLGTELYRRVVDRSCVPMSWHELAPGIPEAPAECN